MAETIIETETGTSETSSSTAPRNARKVREGLVVSNKMDKTVVIAVERSKRHPLYGRVQRVTKKFKAHDETNECNEGDRVRIVETRPISKDKCWRILEVLEKAK